MALMMPDRRNGAVIVFIALAFAATWFGIYRSAEPSRETVEGMVRQALANGWPVMRPEGTEVRLALEDFASLDTFDCRHDKRVETDSPFFACAVSIADRLGVHFFGAFGAEKRSGQEPTAIDGFIVHDWALSEQKQAIADLGLLR